MSFRVAAICAYAQQLVVMRASISAYGAAPAGVLRGGRRGGELHARVGAGAGGAVRRVGAQVRRLERELGVELLDRGPRSVTLTEAGAAVLPFARDALAAVAGVRSGGRGAHRAAARARADRDAHGGTGGADRPTCWPPSTRVTPTSRLTLDRSGLRLAPGRGAGTVSSTLRWLRWRPSGLRASRSRVLIDARDRGRRLADAPARARDMRSSFDELAAAPAHLPAARAPGSARSSTQRACGRGSRSRRAIRACSRMLAARGLGVAILPEPMRGRAAPARSSACAGRSRCAGAPAVPPSPPRGHLCGSV